MITEEEAKRMNDFQNSGRIHPFTCDRKSKKCEANISPRDYSKDGVLIATKECWVCPCGSYRQEYEINN